MIIVLELLYKIFIDHVHKYEIITQVAITHKLTKIGNSYIQQCKCCGKLKQFREIG